MSSRTSSELTPVPLVRNEGGALRPPTSWELDKRKAEAARLTDARTAAAREAVVAAVNADPGLGTVALRAAVRGAGVQLRKDALDQIVRDLLAEGTIMDAGTPQAHRYQPVRLPRCPDPAPGCPGQAPAEACPAAPPLIGAAGAGRVNGAGQEPEQGQLVGAGQESFNDGDAR